MNEVDIMNKTKPKFHTWLGQVEKTGKLLILFKSFPVKQLEKVESYFIQKLNPIFNINLNNGGKYVSYNKKKWCSK